MNKTFTIAIVIAGICLFGSCNGKNSTSGTPDQKEYQEDIDSYVRIRTEHAEAMKNGDFNTAQKLETAESELIDKYRELDMDDKFFADGQKACENAAQ